MLKFDEIWMVPCGDREDKQLRTSGEMRLKMVDRAIEDYFPRGYPVKVHPIEVENGKSIPTYFLMKKLEVLYADQNIKFYFMMGSDLIPGLINWDNGQEMIDECNFTVFERKGYESVLNGLKKEYQMPKCMMVLKANQNLIGMISSTEVRKRI
jgi:nicotinic acid mononucleotide adenylyltransferase